MAVTRVPLSRRGRLRQRSSIAPYHPRIPARGSRGLLVFLQLRDQMDRGATNRLDQQAGHHSGRKTGYAARPHPHVQQPSDGLASGVCWHVHPKFPDHAPTNPRPLGSHRHRRDRSKWSGCATIPANDRWIFQYLRQYAPVPNLATFESPVI